MLNDAVYEWNAHAPLALRAGLRADGLESARTMREGGAKGLVIGEEEGAVVNGLDKRGWAVLGYTDEMTKGVKVGDDVFERLRSVFTDREIVELTAAVAGYNCVSRFLVALDVGENNAKEMKSVKELVENSGGGKSV